MPPLLADWLAAKGHDADHVATILSLNAPDQEIWRAAARQDRTIITKDRDFAIWASERRSGPQVIWLRLGNATSLSLFAWLGPRWPEIEARLAEGVHLIEVRP
ncbi:MAG: DUF5615 family PIN-like protein [Brevundimonas sp.]|nr:DUF5615 family PIN-like protein [Brevundimonas sp.]